MSSSAETAAVESKPEPGILSAGAGRIVSMDQLRGYAIFGMILVNYLGHFDFMPEILHHHRDKASYADTIAPLFMFVVGMGFRLSLQRRLEKKGLAAARWDSFKRYFTLFIVGIAIYGPNMRIDWWDALVDIALAGMLALPFIDKKISTRIAMAVVYLGIFTFFFHYTGPGSHFTFGDQTFAGYGDWLRHKSMNGGPLGPFSHAFILLFGTIAFDLLQSRDTRKILTWSAVCGVGLCALSWVAYKLTPIDYAPYAEYGKWWPYSHRWAAAPSQLLHTGLAFVAFLFFYVTCDLLKFKIPTLTIVGENPLVIYILQYALMAMSGSYFFSEEFGKIKPAVATFGDYAWAIFGFCVFYWFCWAVAKRLHNQGYIIKL
jgi:predicted acyltransferase